MGRKTTRTNNDPWKPAQPYILQGMQQTQRVFDQQQPQLDRFSGMAFDTYGQLNPGAVQGIQGAQGLVNRTIGGEFLSGGNPYLDRMVDSARNNVLNDVKGSFSAAGRFGSNAFADTAADAMASAELGLRFDNYNRERQNQINAVGQAQDLMRGNQATLDQAAALPWTGVGAQVGNIRQASQGYGTTTTTTRDPMGAIVGLAGAGATAWASDERKKRRLGLMGMAPDGVTPLEAYTMKDDPTQTPQVGVMAQAVEKTNPAAVGPTLPDGTKTVNYGALGLPSGPVDMGGNPSAAPVAQQALPNIRKPGVEGWLESVVNPDVSTTRGKVGLMGQALMAGSGGPFAPLGQAMLGARQEIDRRDELQHQRALDIRRADILEQQATLGNRARIVQRRDGSVVAIDPVTLQDTEISGPIQASEPVVATERGFLPRSQAIGLNPYRAPERPSSGGGLTANMRATLKSQAAAAIAKGADPAKVQARLREMGVD